jgi:hypothetical protein
MYEATGTDTRHGLRINSKTRDFAIYADLKPGNKRLRATRRRPSKKHDHLTD